MKIKQDGILSGRSIWQVNSATIAKIFAQMLRSYRQLVDFIESATLNEFGGVFISSKKQR